MDLNTLIPNMLVFFFVQQNYSKMTTKTRFCVFVTLLPNPTDGIIAAEFYKTKSRDNIEPFRIQCHYLLGHLTAMVSVMEVEYRQGGK